MATKFKLFYKDQVYYNTRVSTKGNTSQYESTWFNRNQHESDTNEHEPDIWKTSSVKCSSFFYPIYFQLYHKKLLFYTSIYFIKHRVIHYVKSLRFGVIVVHISPHSDWIRRDTDSNFIKSSILKPKMEF